MVAERKRYNILIIEYNMHFKLAEQKLCFTQQVQSIITVRRETFCNTKKNLCQVDLKPTNLHRQSGLQRTTGHVQLSNNQRM